MWSQILEKMAEKGPRPLFSRQFFLSFNFYFGFIKDSWRSGNKKKGHFNIFDELLEKNLHQRISKKIKFYFFFYFLIEKYINISG